MLLWQLSPWAVLVLVGAGLPSFIAEAKFSGDAFRLFRWRSPETRKQAYLETVLAREDYAKEVKLFGLGPRLLERYREIFDLLYGEDRRPASCSSYRRHPRLRHGVVGGCSRWGVGVRGLDQGPSEPRARSFYCLRGGRTEQGLELILVSCPAWGYHSRMKQFLAGLSLSAAFILGCVTATYAPGTMTATANAEEADGGSSRKWEYSCGPLGPMVNRPEVVTEKFNQFGAVGWELAVTVDVHMVCFKRPL